MRSKYAIENLDNIYKRLSKKEIGKIAKLVFAEFKKRLENTQEQIEKENIFLSSQ